VDRHRDTFAAALPARNLEVRHWLGEPGPVGQLRGVWFLQCSDGATRMERATGSVGPRRVRKPRRAVEPAALNPESSAILPLPRR
jgi:hypothetical protein